MRFAEKSMILIGIILLLSILVYSYAIGPTILKVKNRANLDNQLVELKSVNVDLFTQDSIVEIIQNEIKEKLVQENGSENLSMEVKAVMENAIIKEYQFMQNMEIGYDHALMNSFELSLVTTYPRITELISQLEKQITTSRITSVEMEKVRKQPGEEQLMSVRIFFQQLGEGEWTGE